jgi:TonB family protein
MLRPTAKALTALHQAGLAHARIKPSNIMAAGNQLKLSIDGLRKIGERGGARATSAYDAPEIATAAWSPAADIWSLGMTLVAVLTQNEPKVKTGDEARVAIPETIPQPFREIARQCLQVDPRRRCTLGDIFSQLPMPAGTGAAKVVEAQTEQQRPKRWIVVPIVVAALFLGALVGGKFILRQASTPAAQSRPTFQVPAGVPAAQSPAPFSSKEASGQKGVARGSVLQQVLPDVSLSAQNTIEGRIRVSVQVAVDASGSVSEANLVSPGPSKYFANRALAAARRWKFNPPQVAGQAAASEWILRFQFQRTSTQVFPAEIKP